LEREDDQTNINIAEMKKDIEYLAEGQKILRSDVESVLTEQRSATTAILSKLQEAIKDE
jgi:hypothetical protein